MWLKGTSKHLRNLAKQKRRFSKALHSWHYKPFCISPWFRHVVWKAQADGDGSEEYLLPGTHSHGRGIMRPDGENCFTFLCVFSWFMEILTQTGLQGEPQTCDTSLWDVKMSKSRIYLPKYPRDWDCCTARCQARNYSPHCTDPLWSSALCECIPGILNEWKEGKVKPSEMEVEKFIISICSLLCVLRHQSRKPRGGCSLFLCICNT